MIKIQYSEPFRGICTIRCPHCHGKDFWKHGSYTRRWFHSFGLKDDSVRVVQRYLCLNPHCQHRTFSVQAPDALSYHRFLFTDLLTIAAALHAKTSLHRISRIFGLSRTVLRRAAAFIQRTHVFLDALCREITTGHTTAGLEELLEVAQMRHCWLTLKAMWFRHIYRSAV